ncbi:phage tail tube protein [Halorhodospira sp. 9622]|uniref:phage tail tube protein n=1 Tax=Halorhodospira sp. 9622 TaxID=2899136 RepID=UPI001EE9862F|nr:phage tail tube protein [Halorhodospira sp. 9622]MCG5538946.1 phage tail tube protein [Halorhodospira sp. 9622]
MAKLLRRRFVDAALEQEYGKDPGEDRVALLPREDLSLDVEGETTNRDTVRQSLSQRGHVVTNKMTSLTLPLELRGAGTEDGELQVPETDALLKASLMKREDGARIPVKNLTGGPFKRGEAVTDEDTGSTVGKVADWDPERKVLYLREVPELPEAEEKLTGEESGASGNAKSVGKAYVYRPDSLTPDEQPSVYLRFDLDGLLHKIPGGRATFSIDLTRSEIPGISFTVSGLYREPTDGGPITGTHLDLTPAPVLGAELLLGDLDMSKVAVQSVQADIDNTVEARGDIQSADGYHSHMITGREPSGSIDPEVTDLSTFNPYKDWASNKRVAVAAGIGDAAGERVRVVMPQTQYTQLPYSSRNGIATYDLGFRCVGDDDELMLIYS